VIATIVPAPQIPNLQKQIRDRDNLEAAAIAAGADDTRESWC